MERLTVAEAARRLGVSSEAVRKRIKRGTVEHDQDEGGLTYVYVEVDNPGPNPSPDEVGNPHLERLLQNQEQEIEYLRRQLNAEREAHSETREARRRADHIIAALTERIPELEAPPQSAQEAESVAEEASGDKSRAEAFKEHTEPDSVVSERCPWWRRIFSR